MLQNKIAEIKKSLKHIKFNYREIELASLVMQGKSRREIAGLLNISVNSVHFHLKNVARKFEILANQSHISDAMSR